MHETCSRGALADDHPLMLTGRSPPRRTTGTGILQQQLRSKQKPKVGPAPCSRSRSLQPEPLPAADAAVGSRSRCSVSGAVLPLREAHETLACY
ncbi:uncharacterized protein V6R79_020091 [Siganus canaliculatus]